MAAGRHTHSGGKKLPAKGYILNVHENEKKLYAKEILKLKKIFIKGEIKKYEQNLYILCVSLKTSKNQSIEFQIFNNNLIGLVY